MRNALLLILRALALVAGCVLLSSAAPSAALPTTQFVYQFTAGNHILGFQNDGVYIAGTTHAVRVQFLDARDVKPQAAGSTPAPDRVQPLDRVTWPEVWAGISVAYRAVADGIAESVYTLEPGAAVAQIRWRYSVPAELNADGSLTLNFEAGQMRESAPSAWQDIAGQHIDVPVAFALHSPFEVGFQVGEYDADYPLMIDPKMVWQSAFGTQSDNQGLAIALDAGGFIYVTGKSNTTWGTPVNPYSMLGGDVFVAEINPTTGAVVWNTFLGGTGEDYGYTICVTTNGWVYVGGKSLYSWGTPLNAKNAGEDGFIAKLDAYNGALQWNTFLGGTGSDYIGAVAVDASGYIYVGGTSSATWGTPVVPFAGTSDAFVAKYDSTGTVIAWSTFLGGTGADSHPQIALDTPHSVMYVSGLSLGSWGTPLQNHAGGIDVFVAKLNMGTGAVLWNTFLGATTDDANGGLDVDTSGNVYVAGTSTSTWGAPHNPFQGATAAFVVKINNQGSRQWLTFIGSSTASGYGNSLQVDASGNSYVGGTSYNSWGAPVRDYEGSSDGFVAKLNATGTTLTWNTFLGGAEIDQISGLGIDNLGYAFVVGLSQADWGTTTNYFRPGIDGLVAKLGTGGTVLWHTFLAGSGDDAATGLAIGDDQQVYVVGDSDNTWGTSPMRAHSAGSDMFVAKLDANGNPIKHTFLGGAGNDWGSGIAIIPTWNYVMIAGTSSATWGANNFHGNTDAFIACLDSNLALQWMTFLGGTGYDKGDAIQVVSDAAMYVAGTSSSSWGTPVTPFGGVQDAWVAQVNISDVLQWSTFLGGADVDFATQLAVDPTGDPYLIGNSFTTWGSPVRPFAGSQDMFVAKLNHANGAVLWNTFLGGAGQDNGGGITAGNNAVFIAGSSPATWGAPIRAHSGGKDIVVARLNSNTGALVWHTFLGSAADDSGTALVVDVDGNIYVTGDSHATWGKPVFSYHAESDAFIAKLNSLGALQWNGFWGGTGSDAGFAIQLYENGGLYVAGQSDLVRNGAARQNDALVAKFNLAVTYLPLTVK